MGKKKKLPDSDVLQQNAWTSNIVPITQPAPISRSKLLPVIKGIWHLSKCKNAGCGPCHEPICKAIHRLIHKISTHSCPKAHSKTVRCKTCELWGYIMQAYLQAHIRAAAAGACSSSGCKCHQ